MSTPTKLCIRVKKPKIDSHNNNCRFSGASFTSDGAGVFENLFLPSGRQESAELILAECCTFDWASSITNATGLRTELYNFTEKATISDKSS